MKSTLSPLEVHVNEETLVEKEVAQLTESENDEEINSRVNKDWRIEHVALEAVEHWHEEHEEWTWIDSKQVVRLLHQMPVKKD